MPTPLARATCPLCGVVLVHPSKVRCAFSGEEAQQGLCEFSCPVCGRVLLRGTGPDAVSALWQQGAGTLAPAPFELLEPHLGLPLSYDEALDFHLALARTSCPQRELVEGAPTNASG